MGSNLAPRRRLSNREPIPSRSQKQADVAIDLFGPEQVIALADFTVCHPTAATYVNSYGQSGDAAKKVAAKKVKKYGALATQLGYRFIPFAAETYGKMDEAALQVVRTLGSAAAEESAPRRRWINSSSRGGRSWVGGGLEAVVAT